MPESRVLVVEADLSVRHTLAGILAHEGVQVSLASDGQSALALLEKKPFDVLFAGLRLPIMDGLTVLQRALLIRPDLAAVVLAGHGRLSSCQEAFRTGACDYLTKPFTPVAVHESLVRALACGCRRGGVVAAGAAAAAAAEEADLPLVAESPAMRALQGFVAKIASTDVAVLLRGEPGTRVDLVARAIHRHSRRAAGPLAHVVCKGIYEAELEAVLFGHQPQGVAEGQPSRPGLLESARGGTLFLIDVEGLPLWAQVRLFDALFRNDGGRFAGAQPAPPDVRLIASTSCDLEGAVAEGRFYGGLYYLLNVTSVWVPPLRERRQDIKALVEYYLRQALAAQGIDARKTPWSFTEGAWQRLLNHDWPGNLPELAGVVTHAVAVSEHTSIGETAIACGPRKPESRSADTASVLLSGNLHEIERHILEEMIQRCGGNKAAAARALGLHRRTLYRMLEEGAGEPAAGPAPQGRREGQGETASVAPSRNPACALP
jgi:DNA-binding NtrC family response regulator